MKKSIFFIFLMLLFLFGDCTFEKKSKGRIIFEDSSLKFHINKQDSLLTLLSIIDKQKNSSFVEEPVLNTFFSDNVCLPCPIPIILEDGQIVEPRYYWKNDLLIIQKCAPQGCELSGYNLSDGQSTSIDLGNLGNLTGINSVFIVDYGKHAGLIGFKYREKIEEDGNSVPTLFINKYTFQKIPKNKNIQKIEITINEHNQFLLTVISDTLLSRVKPALFLDSLISLEPFVEIN